MSNPAQRAETRGQAASAWDSDLSVAELASIKRCGFDPLGMVMGTSVFHIGTMRASMFSGFSGIAGQGSASSAGPGGSQVQGGFMQSYPCPHGYGYGGMSVMGAGDHMPGYNWEDVIRRNGIMEARNLALSRLVSEAAALGAHGVVGVDLKVRPMQDMPGVVELKAIGTAIGAHSEAPLETPFTSNLSGQGFEKLMRVGYVPVSMVMGVSVIEADLGCGAGWTMGSWANQEVGQLTDAAQAARDLAVERLEREASAVGDGVVGVTDELATYSAGERTMLVESLLIGTAVRRFDPGQKEASPLVIMRLSDPPQGRRKPGGRRK